jgi:hypothetical protein
MAESNPIRRLVEPYLAVTGVALPSAADAEDIAAIVPSRAVAVLITNAKRPVADQLASWGACICHRPQLHGRAVLKHAFDLTNTAPPE